MIPKTIMIYTFLFIGIKITLINSILTASQMQSFILDPAIIDFIKVKSWVIIDKVLYILRFRWLTR